MTASKEIHEVNDVPPPRQSTDEPKDIQNAQDVKEIPYDEPVSASSNTDEPPQETKRPWYISLKNSFFEPGSATQIVAAALVAIAIGLVVSTQADNIPVAATEIVSIPGDLWLRALQAVVLPLIICAMIIAVQRLRDLDDGTGGKLAAWTVGYYVVTTLIALFVSCLLVALAWAPMFTVVSDEALGLTQAQIDAADERAEAGGENPPHMVVKQMFQSLIPNNVVKALAENQLLSVLVTAVVLGYLIPSRDSVFLKIIIEIEAMIMRVITFLIKLAPVGVFFLILSSLMRLSLSDIGTNLGMLIGFTLANMAVHVFIVYPVMFFAFTRQNPYAFWIKIAPAWVTAWGSASSAATLPVTLRVAAARKIPVTIYKFTCPLGCLINMDGTAIYFPMAVIFLAATSGHELLPTDYVIICLLATLASIGTTPIPSASLVLIVMIANSVGVPVSGMFAVIVAIDWLLDRFRTAINVSGDLFGSVIIQRLTKIVDAPGVVDEELLRQDGEATGASRV